ncbi:uncharacterized protein LOC112973335 [Apteryx rowi]|uniref:uncharacterized protein LOC112973335 n=1 Tax=Apteryx rowi TaxID=308060 RepID=UPI000E1D9BD6|nr:uncharacterized protein LOC112973335 [Apteryx rowi]
MEGGGHPGLQGQGIRAATAGSALAGAWGPWRAPDGGAQREPTGPTRRTGKAGKHPGGGGSGGAHFGLPLRCFLPNGYTHPWACSAHAGAARPVATTGPHTFEASWAAGVQTTEPALPQGGGAVVRALSWGDAAGAKTHTRAPKAEPGSAPLLPPGSRGAGERRQCQTPAPPRSPSAAAASPQPPTAHRGAAMPVPGKGRPVPGQLRAGGRATSAAGASGPQQGRGGTEQVRGQHPPRGPSVPRGGRSGAWGCRSWGGALAPREAAAQLQAELSWWQQQQQTTLEQALQHRHATAQAEERLQRSQEQLQALKQQVGTRPDRLWGPAQGQGSVGPSPPGRLLPRSAWRLSPHSHG